MRIVFRILLISSLLCLFLLGAADPARSQETPIPEPATPVTEPQEMPTPDRLAPPATVIAPTQADDGAQLYWVWCQPCHGDQGQGLTDEWREQYPEDHQYCWESGCHGDLPYEDGFTLPQHVPAVIGGQSLARFATVGELYEYVHLKMPYEYPGALNSEEALAVTAFLARAHGKWEGVPLTLENIDQLHWRALLTATPFPAGENMDPDTDGLNRSGGGLRVGNEVLLMAGLLVFLSVGAYLWKRGR